MRLASNNHVFQVFFLQKSLFYIGKKHKGYNQKDIYWKLPKAC